MHRLLLLSASLLVLIACSPADDGPTGAPDAEEGDASAADTSKGEDGAQEAEADAACNALVLDAPAVGLTYVAYTFVVDARQFGWALALSQAACSRATPPPLVREPRSPRGLSGA
jgi:hypothetical protein